MFNWKHGDPYGQPVRVADSLERRDFNEAAQRERRPGASGIVLKHSDSHGLCFEVRHHDGSTAWYDPDELFPETEEFGRHPVKTGLTVLPADDVKQEKLGWTVREYLGCEVYPYKPDAEGKLPPQLEPIKTEDGLKEGMQILVPSLVGGFHIMTVMKEDNELYARGEKLMGALEFAKEDGRNAWVCVGLINMRGVEKLELRTDG